MTQARTLACISANYITKLVAVAVIIIAIGEAVNAADMWLDARKNG